MYNFLRGLSPRHEDPDICQFCFLSFLQHITGDMHYKGPISKKSWYLNLIYILLKTDTIGRWSTHPTIPNCQYLTIPEWHSKNLLFWLIGPLKLHIAVKGANLPLVHLIGHLSNICYDLDLKLFLYQAFLDGQTVFRANRIQVSNKRKVEKGIELIVL